MLYAAGFDQRLLDDFAFFAAHFKRSLPSNVIPVRHQTNTSISEIQRVHDTCNFLGTSDQMGSFPALPRSTLRSLIAQSNHHKMEFIKTPLWFVIGCPERGFGSAVECHEQEAWRSARDTG
jgi:hypothetical protein